MSTTQLQIDWEAALHRRENSPENESHLKLHRDHFVGRVRTAYDLMSNGVKLNCFTAMTRHGIGHLPSVIRDMRTALNLSKSRYSIKWAYEKDEFGKQLRTKIYWLEIENHNL